MHTRTERFAALDALLSAPDAAWGTLMTLLAWWPSSQDQEQAVARAEALADRWPDDQRVLTRICVRHLLDGQVPPYLRLLRNLDMRPLHGPRRVVLLSRMIREAGLRRLGSFMVRYDEGEALLAELLAHVEGLRSLSLGACSIGDRGAVALARCPRLAGLESLAIYGNLIGDAGALALLESPWLRQLRYLNLYHNAISPAVVARFEQVPWCHGAKILLHAQRRA